MTSEFWLKNYAIYVSNFIAGSLIGSLYLNNLPKWFLVFPSIVLGLSALYALGKEIQAEKEAKKNE